MKIMFAITGFLPELIGGAEVYTLNLAKGLIEKGHNVSVLTLDFKHERGYPTDDLFEGVPVHRMGFVRDYRPAPLYALQFYPEMYNEAKYYLKHIRPDLIHATNAWFISGITLAAMQMNIPVLATHVDFLWTCRESHRLQFDQSLCDPQTDADCRECYDDLTDSQWELTMAYRKTLGALLTKGYSFHHCPSPVMAEQITRLGADPEKINVWPYGVPDDLKSRRPVKTPSVNLRLGFIGRWNRIKGIDVLLDAMDLIDKNLPVELYLYGEREVWNKDEYGTREINRARKLPNVTIKGRFMPDQLVEIHSEIDCLVMPSIWPENSPLAILESLALGTPVICSDGEGMTHLINKGQNGFIFQNRNEKELAAIIMNLVGNPDQLRHLQSEAWGLGTISDDIARFESIYRSATPPSAKGWYKEAENWINTMRFANEVYLAKRK